MKAGKLSETVLKRSVLKQLHTRRPEVIQGPGVGQDAALFQTVSGKAAGAVCSIPLTSVMLVPVTVYTACNNIACCGAEPLGILADLILPTGASEQTLRDLIGEIEAVCARENIQVLGGHTQTSRSVTEAVLSVTAIGTLHARTDEVKPGMDILVTKEIGTAGAAILVRECEEELASRYTRPFLDRAKVEDAYLSVRKEAAAAAPAVMHDISQGGIYGALWELGERFRVGLEIDLKKIPIRQETVEICEFFRLNPYKLLSTGCLLIVAEDGSAVAEEIERAGGTAAVIGKATDGNDRVLLCEEERRFLETAQTDELYKIIRSFEA